MIDGSNLLFAAKDSEELYNGLIAVLPYTGNEVENKEGFIHVNSLQHYDYTTSLIEEMRLCNTGKLMANKYEKVCLKLLKNAFSDDLTLWKELQPSNNNLYRFDFLYRIKDGEQKSFWAILEKYFNSKYVIFEFKNYGNPIT